MLQPWPVRRWIEISDPAFAGNTRPWSSSTSNAVSIAATCPRTPTRRVAVDGAPEAEVTVVTAVGVEGSPKIPCSCGPVTGARPRVPTTWADTIRRETPCLLTAIPTSPPLTSDPSFAVRRRDRQLVGPRVVGVVGGPVVRVADALQPRLRGEPGHASSTFSVWPPELDEKYVIAGLPW